METNELRIGNYIKAGENIIRVDAIMPLRVEVYLNHGIGIAQIGEIFPIQVTKQILLSNGFSMSYASDPQEEDAIEKYKNGTFEIFSFEKSGVLFLELMGLMRDIEHIHQLQNLYFAIYNEELELNLE